MTRNQKVATIYYKCWRHMITKHLLSRTPHDSMQVQMYVNDYPAWCSSEDGEGCSYEYDSSLNTEVTSISQADGATTGDIDLTISGTGFTNNMDTVVKVGNGLMMCQPTSVASDEIGNSNFGLKFNHQMAIKQKLA